MAARLPEVRAIEARDRDDWDRLYEGYAAFYRVEQTPAMRDAVWSWLMDPGHEVEGLVAQGEAGLLGLAHVRPFARPLSASTGGFLDDLFVAPESRGQGVAAALIEAVAARARERGWSVVRWITAEDNARARALYDRVASPTRWVTYDMRP